jgi:hypothetical protein
VQGPAAAWIAWKSGQRPEQVGKRRSRGDKEVDVGAGARATRMMSWTAATRGGPRLGARPSSVSQSGRWAEADARRSVWLEGATAPLSRRIGRMICRYFYLLHGEYYREHFL